MPQITSKQEKSGGRQILLHGTVCRMCPHPIRALIVIFLCPPYDSSVLWQHHCWVESAVGERHAIGEGGCRQRMAGPTPAPTLPLHPQVRHITALVMHLMYEVFQFYIITHRPGQLPDRHFVNKCTHYQHRCGVWFGCIILCRTANNQY